MQHMMNTRVSDDTLALASTICISRGANGEIRRRSNYLLVTQAGALQHQNTHPMTLTDQRQVAT